MERSGRHRQLAICWWACFIFLASLLEQTTCELRPTVTEISVTEGSTGGGVKFKLSGTGFSQDPFSLDAVGGTKGNVVKFISDKLHVYHCVVDNIDSNDQTIIAYTPMLKPGTYTLSLTVDGLLAKDTDNIKYEALDELTPTVASVSPQSGPPGMFVDLAGRIFTDLYAGGGTEATNGLTEQISLVWLGPKPAEVKDDSETLYGIEVDLSSVNDAYGTIRAKSQGTSVGFHNVRFIVDGKYGSSIADASAERISYNDIVHNFQAYTDILHVTPNVGSIRGETTVTVTGHYYDARKPYTDPQVYIGGTVCDVVTTDEVTGTIVCKTQPKPEITPSIYAGSRGLTLTTFASDVNQPLATYLDNASPASTFNIDDTRLCDVSLNGQVIMMSGLYRPPHDGSFMFRLYSDNGANLYIDKNLVIESADGPKLTMDSGRMTLDSNKRYLLQVVEKSGNEGQSCIDMSVKHFDTKLTRAQTVLADQKRQNIIIRSQAQPDVQKMEFTQHMLVKQELADEEKLRGENPKEVQQVCAYGTGTFRLQMFGVSTGPIHPYDTQTTVRNEMRSLPIFSATDRIEVKMKPDCYEIEFLTQRGDLPALECVAATEEVECEVTTLKDGASDTNIYLTFGGVPSNIFDVKTLTNESLHDAIWPIFEARCPKFLTSSGGLFNIDAESASLPFTRATRVEDDDAFCGRYYLKNPQYLFFETTNTPAFYALTFSQLCFAYKGPVKSVLVMTYRYISNDVARSGYKVQLPVDIALPDDENTWAYTCIDMMKLLETRHPNEDYDTFLISNLNVIADKQWNTIYIDAIHVGRAATTTDIANINERRLAPYMAELPRRSIIRKMGIVEDDSGSFTVSLYPSKCGYDLPMFTLWSAEDTGEELVVTKIGAATPPVTGDVSLSFKGHSMRDINTENTTSMIKMHIETNPEIGEVTVEHGGDCANFDLKVTLDTLPGDQEMMKIVGSRLSTVNDATVDIIEDTVGGLWYMPITGDTVSPPYDNPQVEVYINGVPSKCETDCSFTWDITAAVTQIVPISGRADDFVTISGSGLSDAVNGNSVTIAGVPCPILTASPTELTCVLGAAAAGKHGVIVYVADIGIASGDVTFTYEAVLEEIYPLSCSLGGGLELTLIGEAFGPSSQVSVGDNECAIVYIDLQQITCTIPQSVTEGSVPVRVVQENAVELQSRDDFIYDVSQTVTIFEWEPRILSIQGSDSIIVTTSPFDVDIADIQVYIGSQLAVVDSLNSIEDGNRTAIHSYVGPIRTPGADIPVMVLFKGLGVATTESLTLPTIQVNLEVHSVSPDVVSLYGGAKVTIAGQGLLAPIDNIEVSFSQHDCVVNSVTNFAIVCTIRDTTSQHFVTSTAELMEFSPRHLMVDVGDRVTWGWQSPTELPTITRGIFQTSSASSTILVDNGVSSGSTAHSGSFTHRFVFPGIYHIWSGPVNAEGTISHRMLVNVVDKQAFMGGLRVTIMGNTVPILKAQRRKRAAAATKECTIDCSPPDTGSSTTVGSYFTSCAVPVITRVQPNFGPITTPITIDGSAFSSCGYTIKFGNLPCTITSQTETMITCTPDRNVEVPIAEPQEIEVTMPEIGNAFVAIDNMGDKSFAVVPSIEHVLPSVGSTVGGTEVAIRGYGFQDVTRIYFGFSGVCSVVSQSNSMITCLTPARSESDVPIMVSLEKGAIPCDELSVCVFSYTAASTPTVTEVEVTDAAVNGITITGTNLQDAHTVEIGGVTCTIYSKDFASFECHMLDIPAGEHNIVITTPLGYADVTPTLTGQTTVTDIQPNTISTGGACITITGHGFVEGQTTVSVDNVNCDIVELSAVMIECEARAHSAGVATVSVVSNGVPAEPAQVTYSSEHTPIVTSIQPPTGNTGENIEILGDLLDANGGPPVVTIGTALCDVETFNMTLIQCTLGYQTAGINAIAVYVPQYGYAAHIGIEFTYEMSVTDFIPKEGGTGGGVTVNIYGAGFHAAIFVSVCDTPCSETLVLSSNHVQCVTPPLSECTCSLVVTSNGLKKTTLETFEYLESLTATITEIYPIEGTNGGGTLLTIFGQGFFAGDESITTESENGADNDTDVVDRRRRSSDDKGWTVDVGGSTCSVETVTETQIQCRTGSYKGKGKDTVVKMRKRKRGNAKWRRGARNRFSYMHYWSSTTTWGDNDPPVAGDFVVIPPDTTIYLDISTPILRGLLIQGGHLIFLDKDLELNSKFILITDGGSLEVGSEAEPFESTAIITLYGHHRDKELPVYGMKFIAVREGALELHGWPTVKTWTRLSETAAVGATTLFLQTPVDWSVGSEIVIATTGLRHSQHETETATVMAVSADGTQLTLNKALEYEHLGESELIDETGDTMEFYAEVGLLSHNVVVRGDPNSVCEEVIEACPQNYHSGETVVQTCFEGRFGEETGNSQFGVQMIIHSGVTGRNAVAHISYTEITFAGQAYRVGRHPIHFYQQPHMDGSYVIGCSIHLTFNRAIHIHGSHNLVIEWNVLYDVMGGAVYMADSTEQNHLIQYNLGVFVKPSSSMLNQDRNPATFWITNPLNTVRHNAAAGGTHFGYWYRMLGCSQYTLLGEFSNNTAHSFGWYGLWLYENYFPMRNGYCSLHAHGYSRPAVFSHFYSWNNEKGAEFVNGGALQFANCKLYNNEKAGLEGHKVMSIQQYTKDGPMLVDSLVVGKTSTQPDVPCTTAAVVLPHGGGFQVLRTTFVNFADADCAVFMWALISHTCSDLCGGYTTRVHDLAFINAHNRAKYRWSYEGIIFDVGDPCEDDDQGEDDSSNSSVGSSTDSSENKGSTADDSENKGSKADSSKNKGSEGKGSKADGSENKGSKADGSKNKGSKADGSKNKGSKADGSDNNGSKADDSENEAIREKEEREEKKEERQEEKEERKEEKVEKKEEREEKKEERQEEKEERKEEKVEKKEEREEKKEERQEEKEERKEEKAENNEEKEEKRDERQEEKEERKEEKAEKKEEREEKKEERQEENEERKEEKAEKKEEREEKKEEKQEEKEERHEDKAERKEKTEKNEEREEKKEERQEEKEEREEEKEERKEEKVEKKKEREENKEERQEKNEERQEEKAERKEDKTEKKEEREEKKEERQEEKEERQEEKEERKEEKAEHKEEREEKKEERQEEKEERKEKKEEKQEEKEERQEDKAERKEEKTEKNEEREEKKEERQEEKEERKEEKVEKKEEREENKEERQEKKEERQEDKAERKEEKTEKKEEMEGKKEERQEEKGERQEEKEERKEEKAEKKEEREEKKEEVQEEKEERKEEKAEKKEEREEKEEEKQEEKEERQEDKANRKEEKTEKNEEREEKKEERQEEKEERKEEKVEKKEEREENKEERQEKKEERQEEKAERKEEKTEKKEEREEKKEERQEEKEERKEEKAENNEEKEEKREERQEEKEERKEEKAEKKEEREGKKEERQEMKEERKEKKEERKEEKRKSKSGTSSSSSSSSSSCDSSFEGMKIMPIDEILQSDDCQPASLYSVGVNAQMCDSRNSYHRFSFNGVVPYSLNGKVLNLTNILGSSRSEQRVNRLSHSYAWMALLLGHQTYNLQWIDGSHMTNISFRGILSDFHEGDWVVLELKINELPDICTINGVTRDMTNTSLFDPDNLVNGDWTYMEEEQKVQLIVHERTSNARRKKRMTVYSIDRYVNFKCIKCFFKHCILPPAPDDLPLAKKRPDEFQLWHDMMIWNNTLYPDWVTNDGGDYGIPAYNDSVMIMPDTWVVINDKINLLRRLVIYGVVELDNRYFHYIINAEHITIIGGRLIIGWPEPENHFIGTALINLRGSLFSEEFNFVNGIRAGAKAIGVYGGLEINCNVSNITWTYLSQTAFPGDTTVTLDTTVDWLPGQEIVITSTSYDPAQTETMIIASVSNVGASTQLELVSPLQYKHIHHADPSLEIVLAAAVGLLSRNCRIIGEEYDDMYKESFGGRVIVGMGQDQFLTKHTFTGYARLYGVEFHLMGQEGWTNSYNPRFSLAYYNTGKFRKNKPSSVKSCSFNFAFNTAMGVFGSEDLLISDNVIYRPVGNGLVTESKNTSIIGNLMVWPVWTGSYNDREELPNNRWEAGIEAMLSTALVLKYNLVAGAERIGYHVPGELCTSTVGSRYLLNQAHGCVTGWMAFQDDMYERSAGCRRYSSFLAWKNAYYGLYVNTVHSTQVYNLTAVENPLSIFTMVIGPSAVRHEYAPKYISLLQSTLVGITSSFDCENDVLPSNTNMELASSCAPPPLPTGGMTGVLWPQFTSSGNGAPVWACAAIQAEPTIMGIMRMEDVVFANFGATCRGDVAISTSKLNDYGYHPVYTSRLKFPNTDSKNRVFIHRPNLAKINPADCVDMDCDAHKKALFWDTDGSTLGEAGTLISESEWQWNGDRHRGLSDYRIPKTMITTADGCTNCDIATSGHGIIRNDECSVFETLVPGITSWECHGLDHEMLIIESLDADYLTRRISPVAILSDGYLDLINGPPDHHYCSGYTCHTRLSTFMAIVATEKTYKLHFTGTLPDNVRFFLLNVDDDAAVLVSMYHSHSNRLDVYINDGSTYIAPTNSFYDTEGNFWFNEGSASSFMPDFTNSSGTNFLERDTRYLHFLVKGPLPLVIQNAPVIFVSFDFPTITVDEFYGADIIDHIAALLDIAAEKVRIAEITDNLLSGAKRRRRATDGVTVKFEIGNPPAVTSDAVVETPLTEGDLQQVAVIIIEECQARNISSTLNVSDVGCETLTVNSVTYNLPVPTDLDITRIPVASHEMELFSIQPVIWVLDSNGQVITELGHPDFPWQITASISSGSGHNDAVLTGATTVAVNNGIFTFTNLSISHMGDNYTIDFKVTYPVNITMEVQSEPFSVGERQIDARVLAVPAGHSEKDLPFQVTLEMYHVETGDAIMDIGWRDHTWTATAALLRESEYASLAGTLVAPFNTTSGQVTFDNLVLTGTGFYHIQFVIRSTPSEFTFSVVQNIKVQSIHQLAMPKEHPTMVEIEFDADFEQLLPTTERQSAFVDAWTQHYAFTYPSTVVQDVTIRKGSIIVAFMIDGSSTDVNGTIYRMCDAITNETAFIFDDATLIPAPYMSVDGDKYYGVVCGPIIIADTGLRDDMVIGLAVVAAVLAAAIVGLLVWRWWRKTRPTKGSVGSTTSFDIFGSRVQTPKPKVPEGKVRPKMRTVQVQEICNTKYRGSGMLDSASIVYPDSGRLHSSRSNASLSSMWSTWTTDSMPPPYKE